MTKVLILLSTYNGEKFIEKQIDSIFSQEDVDVYILVRDDGSTDNTLNILKGLALKYKKIKIIAGKNCGWRKSFSTLIMESEEYKYYAFADQDDYWFSNKIINALSKIEKFDNIPCLYRGRSYIADSSLRNTGKKFQDIAVPSISKSLFHNYCQGCTLVFNNELKKMYKKFPLDVVSHDIWLPLIALHTGKIIDDTNAYMLYRIHDNNATANITILNDFIRHIKCIFSKELNNYNINFGALLYNNYKDFLNENSLNVCYKMANFSHSMPIKISLLFSKEIRGNTILRTFIVKLFILMNKFRSDV